MNTLKDMLELAVGDGHGPEPGRAVDPAPDLARGRARLHRRRTAVLSGTAAVAVTLGVAPLAANLGNAPPTSGHEASTRSTTASLEPIALVAYTGEQAPGYRVAEVPQGWVVQGGDAYKLTIGLEGTEDTEPDSFLGKIVVMLQSRDAGEPTGGVAQPVDGRPGWLVVEGPTQMLTYRDADGRWMVVQAPVSLGWDGARLARFAAGVEVLGNAEESRG
ncbi:MAG: hypothetical protein GXX79_21570 [Actinomycetales bacterium]|nr:hypothetical protein [Actinomycetales bacterium]